MKHLQYIPAQTGKNAGFALMTGAITSGVVIGSLPAIRLAGEHTPWLHQYFSPLLCGDTVFAVFGKTLLSELLFLAAVASPALADDYSYLNFTKSDGTVVSLSVSNLQLTISDGKLLATNDDGSETFQLADLAKMYFSDAATGISSVGAGDAAVETVTAYSLSGVNMGSYKSAAEAKVQLRPGVYLLKSKSKTIKTVVQ